MSRGKVSVIVPAYGQADFLGEAIQSVLNQTYEDFELIVVNDASPDHTSQVVKQFNDPRIIYLLHETNKMLPATRNTGIRASSGEIIALLDADDIYHPEKLEKHVAYLNANPEIGVTYNARFVLNHSQNTIRELVRPPLTVTLKDLVLGFPFAPSDMVIRRDWLFQVGLFDETFTSFSEDLEINCQLALAGCKFASIDKALNYRRYHSGRIIKNIDDRLEGALRSLKNTFSDSRCPQSLLAERETAFINSFRAWAYTAFSQGETALGQKYLQEAFRRDPSMIIGKPCELISFFLHNCIADDNVDHALHLRQILLQLPNEMEQVIEQYDWAVARGYLLKAIRAITWGRIDDGRIYFTKAYDMKAKIDKYIVGLLTHQLLNYENEFGTDSTREVMKELSPYLTQLGGQQAMRQLFGNYSFNLAFQNYQTGNYKEVLRDIFYALINEPRYIGNRGIWSVLWHSISKQALS